MLPEQMILRMLLALMLIGNEHNLPQMETGTSCLVLALDGSRSMATSDPTFLRNTGARLFISLLDSHDQVGVAHFSDHATVISNGMESLEPSGRKEGLLQRIIDTPPAGGTDILAALEASANLFEQASCTRRTVILLTDGKPDLPGGLPADYEARAVALVHKMNAQVNTILLNSSAVPPLIFALSNATQPVGRLFPAQNAGNLLEAFLFTFAYIKDQVVLRMEESKTPGAVELTIDRALAPYIERATFLVSKPSESQSVIFGPHQSNLLANQEGFEFTYTLDQRFAVYESGSVAPGQWGFRFQGLGNFQALAILRTRLRVELLEPTAYSPLGQNLKVAARMVEEDENAKGVTLVGEASFAARLKLPDGSQVSLDQLFDDGTHGDVLAGDGIFTHTYPKTDLPGQYEITVTGYKSIVPVQATTVTQVIPFPQLKFNRPLCNEETHFLGQPIPFETEFEQSATVSIENAQAAASVTSPDGTKHWITLDNTGGRLAGVFTPHSVGNYRISLEVQDASYQGSRFSIGADCLFRVAPAPLTETPAVTRIMPTPNSTIENALTVVAPGKENSFHSIPSVLIILGSLIGIGGLSLGIYFSRLPAPWGMLRVCKAPLGCMPPSPIRINKVRRKLFSHELTIGGREADFVLPGIAGPQAVIRAAWGIIYQRAGKPPRMIPVRALGNVLYNAGKDTVFVNHLPVAPGQQSLPLTTGTKIRIGGYELEYLP